MKSRLYSLILTLGCCLMAALGPAQAEDVFSAAGDSPFRSENAAEFLPVDEAFHAYAWHDSKRVYIGIRNQPGYYLYRQRLALESDQPEITLGPLEAPSGQFKHDQYLGDVHVFYDQVEISAPLTGQEQRNPNQPISITLSFQGCADAGLCYPPEHWRLTARPGPAPAAYRDASSEAMASPIGTSEADTANDPFSTRETSQALSNPAVEAFETMPSASMTSASMTLAGDVEPLSSASADGQFQSLLRAGIDPSTLGLFFLAGLGLTFTPCVLPMLPILTSIIVGQNARRRRALTLSLSYVTGMAVTFMLLGTLMGLFGASLNLQARLQSAWVLAPLALLFALFAAAMFGLFDLRLPNGLNQRVDAWQARLQRSGPLGLASAGALSVLVVSPCVSAPLAGALVFISTTSDALGGAMALLALGLGMGAPLVVAGTFGTQWLPRAGGWMTGIKALFGVMLLGVAIWLVERIVPGPVALLLWGVLTLGCALALGPLRARPTTRFFSAPDAALGSSSAPDAAPRSFSAPDAAPVGRFRGGSLIRQTAGWVLLVWGVAMVWGAAQGGSDPLRPLPAAVSTSSPDAAPRFETVSNLDQLEAALAAADRAGRPAMVDVSADWCISCKVMERDVFPRPAVAQRLAGFTLIRADVTRDAPASRRLLEHYDLFGPPGLLFFAHGKELPRARVQGEVDARALIQHLDAVAQLREAKATVSAPGRSSRDS
ncbi:protein-disulfide reductase DsbD [Salinicola halophyticus]|uniref:protein-disulfide reductase DsbD n=1 Tax=Salinicola halophyticus TaxID=1808881 RepID=UPI003F4552D7